MYNDSPLRSQNDKVLENESRGRSKSRLEISTLKALGTINSQRKLALRDNSFSEPRLHKQLEPPSDYVDLPIKRAKVPIGPISRHTSLQKIKTIVGKSQSKLATGGFNDSKLRDTMNSTFYTQHEDDRESPRDKDSQRGQIRQLIHYIATAPNLTERDLGMSNSRVKLSNRQFLLAAL